jgi:hypothetical protein
VFFFFGFSSTGLEVPTKNGFVGVVEAGGVPTEPSETD